MIAAQLFLFEKQKGKYTVCTRLVVCTILIYLSNYIYLLIKFTERLFFYIDISILILKTAVRLKFYSNSV